MSVAYNPQIVKDGLIFYLDPANRKSYPGSGTTWFDLVGNNHGTLTNSPTYNSANNGIFNFDGTNDFVSFTDSGLLPTAGLTLSAWCRTSVADKWLLDKSNGTVSSGWALIGTSASKIQFTLGSTGVTSVENITTNAFTHVTATWIPSTSLIIYLNSIQSNINTTSIPAVIPNQTVGLRIGGRTNNATDYWNGSIGQISIYNRGLSAAEVRQNFQATRGRYGI